MRIVIAGCGAWGTAFARAIGGDLSFWSRNSDSARAAAAATGGEWRANLEDAAAEGDLIVVAVGSGGFASVLQKIGRCSGAPVLWLTKGFAGGGRLLCEIAAEILPPGACFGALSGPTFAAEVARGLPAAMTIALNRPHLSPCPRAALHRKMLRLYPSADLTGVCVAGALKNVIAVAAGIVDGLRLGVNARAAIVARGLAEIAAFNRAAGGDARTIFGVAGVGDVLLTCTSDLSRNRRHGLAIGGGLAPSRAATTEGVAAAASAARRCREMGIAAPIIAATNAVLHEGEDPRRAAEMLLSRPPPETECAAE